MGLQVHNALMAAWPRGHTTKGPWLGLDVRMALHVPGPLHCVRDTHRACMGMQVNRGAGWVCARPMQAHVWLWALGVSKLMPGLGTAQGSHAGGNPKHAWRW